ncbi:MAG: DUF302 domain-containing protein [Bacteroidetes bacterium]|nr:DUF302 domain-containing protein [Bacteroidota bacterium]
MQYGIRTTTSYSFEQAVERVTEELKKEGFGVLTSIDMKETLHKKLGVEIGRYTILGACNPQFANNALKAEQEIGLFLPCNVIVYEDGAGVTVSAFDPSVIDAVIPNDALHTLSRDVQQRLRNVIAAL